MHRLDVVFDEELRSKTIAAAAGVHQLFASGVTPPPEYGPKCKQCSLIDICMPQVLERAGSAKRYVQKLYRELSEEEI
jgi:CRISPR-associated exonuclease Cas4